MKKSNGIGFPTLWCLGGLLFVTAGFLVLQLTSDRASSEAKKAETTPQSQQTTTASTNSTLANQAAAIPQGKYARDARIAANPDAHYDPNRSDPGYQRILARHREISRFTTSTRRDDPAYRRIMVTLLENGYDVKDWAEAVSIMGVYHMPVVTSRKQMIIEGFSPQQIEQDLDVAKAHQENMRDLVYDNFRDRIGITDRALVDRLLSIEIDFENQEEVIGDGAIRMIRGDRLLTESDWLDTEFAAAQDRYTGPERTAAPVSLDGIEEIRSASAKTGRLPVAPPESQPGRN